MTFQEIMLNEISNQVLKKDVTYDNIKSHKKQGFTLSLENMFLEKRQGIQLNASLIQRNIIYVYK